MHDSEIFALQVVALVVVASFVAGAVRRLGWPPPLVLVVVGVVGSYVPGVPEYSLDPDVILVGLLPPLLYAAAIRTSLVDFRANRQAIALLSVGLVAFTCVAVGFVAWWVTPGVSLAAALALGAVVSPPDAVAATTVARRVGMPRRIVSLLEGESLVNDATALVALTTATAAITGSVSAPEVGWDFVVAAGGGVAVGLAAAMVLAVVRKYVDDPVLDTTLSFAAPFVAFLPAEAIDASGVLAVVVTGLVLGHKSPRLQSGASRLAEQTNWATVQFVLENVVFLLIGLQLRGILDRVGSADIAGGRVVLICITVLAVTIVARIVWVLGAVAVYHSVPQLRRRAWPWSQGLVVSWAGMRGVVTLAAANALPEETPQRDVLVLAAFGVAAGTLLVQGLSLPGLVRRLGLRGPDPADDALQTAALVSQACRAGWERLDEVRSPDDPEEVIADLRERAMRRKNLAWERLGRSQRELEPPGVTYRRLRLQMLDAERATVVQTRDRGGADDEILRQVMTLIDVEESLIDRVEDATPRVDGELVPSPALTIECEHLRDAPHTAEPRTPGACEECLRDGTRWVHLRTCLTCGHVGCCDSSVGRHATGHFFETHHPVMRSAEPGEAWRWCYIDKSLG